MTLGKSFLFPGPQFALLSNGRVGFNVLSDVFQLCHLESPKGQTQKCNRRRWGDLGIRGEGEEGCRLLGVWGQQPPSALQLPGFQPRQGQGPEEGLQNEVEAGCAVRGQDSGFSLSFAASELKGVPGVKDRTLPLVSTWSQVRPHQIEARAVKVHQPHSQILPFTNSFIHLFTHS